MGENISLKYLEKIGYKILEKNFACRQGEIDIIAKDKLEIVIIEVKTRSNLNYGNPREAVDKNKKNHIYNSAKYYIHVNKLENNYIRFDVIEIYKIKNRFKLKHLKNVDIKHWFKLKNVVKYFSELKNEKSNR